ncbi:hypothetical protein QVD17_33945 [Tagetes erecta]|uniref:Protein kinase domain-containing protein n=1 Tax=Tagetes erecta TaxID=13708 RepID=A0AAD8NE66_TARER|nr:hypothetical protein QVD17_33945 [Tagetes erecta]
MSESPELRWSFIRKIYSVVAILSLLSVTVSYHPVVTFFTTLSAELACYLLILITSFITLCHRQRHHLINYYVLLLIFTVSLAFTVGVSCAFTIGPENVNSIADKFGRVLVEDDGCTYWILKDDQPFGHVSLHASAPILNHSHGGAIDLYRGGDRDQCFSSEDLAFLGLFTPHNENQESFEGTHPKTRYILKKRFDRGAYGEVWVAFHLHSTENETTSALNIFIVKRILVERGNTAYLSGIREKYFGQLFLDASSQSRGTLSVNESLAPEHIAYEEGLQHIARYVESFGYKSDYIWLVFRHEGTSLSKLLYTSEDTGSSDGTKLVPILHPSKWWLWLKTTEAGQAEMKNLIRQLLMALKSCHDRNITHRDIKPDNMIICFEDQNSRRCLKRNPSGNETYITKMRIIDFGSAMDEFTIKHLYGAAGPSRNEETYEYMPPEAHLNATWYYGPSSITTKYDMWSVGIVILELIIGSPNVFQIDARAHILLDQHVEGWNEGLKKLAYKLKAFMDLCILLPGSYVKHLTQVHNGKGSGPPAPWKCSEEIFLSLFKSRDPLKIGFPNVWAMRLVRQLLVWDPEDRLTVDDALGHPYFAHNDQQV